MISVKFELRYYSLKSKFSLILSAYILMTGMDTLERVEKIIRESALDKKKKKAWLNLTPG